MIWGCFTWWKLGLLVKIYGIMKNEDYLHLLQTNLPHFIDQGSYPEDEVIFQQEGDPKQASKNLDKNFS